MAPGLALSDVSYLTFAQLEAQRLEQLKLECLERRIDLDIELGSAQALAGELGLEPSIALRSLESQMLRQDPELNPVMAAAETARGNVDHRGSVFIGRSEEIGQVDGLLGDSRLVTLTGVGGVGKTSLALHTARQALGSWPDGVWLVEFGPVSDPRSVRDALAAALTFSPQFGEDTLEGVIRHLQHSSRLIILDNCEHVVDAAASLADALLSRCPGVHLLVTSREPLGVPDETVMTIQPMDTPTSEVISRTRLRLEREASI